MKTEAAVLTGASGFFNVGEDPEIPGQQDPAATAGGHARHATPSCPSIRGNMLLPQLNALYP